MSLNFDFSKMIDRVGREEYDRLTTHPDDLGKSDDEQRRWHPVTNSVIWSALTLDLNSIKADNLDEWVYRATLLQHATGAFLSNKDGPIFLTREDYALHVGLVTNVSTLSRVEWLKKFFCAGKYRKAGIDLRQPPHTNSAWSIAAGGPRDGKPLGELLAEDAGTAETPAV